MRYVIKGDPIPLSKHKSTSSTLWDKMRENKRFYSISLENQQNNKPLPYTPIEMNIIFYMPPDKDEEKSLYHDSKPTLISLINFIEAVAVGTIYPNNKILSSITAKKIYDYNPRTEIIINEL